MVRGINSRIWVVIVKPGSTNIGVLFHDNVWNAKCLQLDSGADPGKTGADDQYLEPSRQNRGCRPTNISVNKPQLFEQHGCVLWRHIFCHAGTHHAGESL